MIQKFSNFRPNTLKKAKNASNNAILSTKKGLIRYFLCIKPMLSICVKLPILIQIAYTPLKVRTVHSKCVQLKSIKITFSFSSFYFIEPHVLCY